MNKTYKIIWIKNIHKEELITTERALLFFNNPVEWIDKIGDYNTICLKYEFVLKEENGWFHIYKKGDE